MKVALGAVINEAKTHLLLARRHAHQVKGGYWELPGGKLEAGETPLAALRRECEEELGIVVEKTHFLGEFFYPYPALSVCLQVFIVLRFTGEPRSRLDQVLAWVPKASLHEYRLPEANDQFLPLIAAQLLDSP